MQRIPKSTEKISWPQNLIGDIFQGKNVPSTKEDDLEKLFLLVLSEREQKVIYTLYRDGGRLQDAGEILNKSKERVRQISREAVHKLQTQWSLEFLSIGAAEFEKKRDELYAEAQKQFSIAADLTESAAALPITALQEISPYQKLLKKSGVFTVRDLVVWYVWEFQKNEPFMYHKYTEMISAIQHAIAQLTEHTGDEWFEKLSTRSKNELLHMFKKLPTLQDIAFAGARRIFYLQGVGKNTFLEIAVLMAEQELDRKRGYSWPTREDIESFRNDDEGAAFYKAIKKKLEKTGGKNVPANINVIHAGADGLCRIFPSEIRPGDTVFYHSSPRIVSSVLWDDIPSVISDAGCKYAISDLQ